MNKQGLIDADDNPWGKLIYWSNEQVDTPTRRWNLAQKYLLDQREKPIPQDLTDTIKTYECPELSEEERDAAADILRDGIMATYHIPYIDFRHVSFEWDVNFSGAHFVWAAEFEGTRFNADAQFTHTMFHEEAIFRKSHFQKSIDFQSAIITGDCDFSGTTFMEEAFFCRAVFHSGLEFRGFMPTGPLDFSNARFNGPVSFNWSKDAKAPFFNEFFPSRIPP